MVLWSQGECERAANCCLEATKLAGSLKYKPVLASASITLGNILSGEGRFAEAIEWYRRAGALASELDDRPGMSWVISNISLILAHYGDYHRAAAGFELSLRKARETGDRWTACLNIAGLAAVNERLGRVDEAERLNQKAIFFEQRLGIPTYLSERYRGLHGDTVDLSPLPDVADLIPQQREPFDLTPLLAELEASFALADSA